jgi:glycosyltransferase involved in cell wall biosynthesis
MYKVLLRAINVDTLIVLDTVSVALPAVLAGAVLGKKIVVRVGGDFVWERYIERTGEKILLSEFYVKNKKLKLTNKEKLTIWLQKNVVFKLASKVVFNTKWQIDVWEKPYKINKEKISVIDNACGKSDLKHVGGNTFLCAWRPTAFKNVDMLEKAHRLAKEKCGDVKLDIFKGMPREELHEKMQYARALVIPSLTELSPNMAFEALSMGLPVVLTRDCGAKEIIGNAVVWIDPKDENDIADKMCDMLDDKIYEKMKRNIENFSCLHTYSDIAKEFLKVVEKK